jgi:putative endonuclease
VASSPSSDEQPAFFVYLVECADGSLYCGIAKDVERRIERHNEGKGARYTRGRGPVALVGQAGPFVWGEALRLERELKARRRAEKLRVFSEG